MRALCPFLGAGAGHVQKPEGESARDMSGSREGGEAAGSAGCQGLVLDMPAAPRLVPYAEGQEWTCSPVPRDMLIPGRELVPECWTGCYEPKLRGPGRGIAPGSGP